MQIAPDLAQPDGNVAELGGRSTELGRDPLEGRQCTLGPRCEGRRALAFLRRDRFGCIRRRLLQLGDVPETLALRAQALLVTGPEAGGVLDERLQPRQPRRSGAGVAPELVGPSAG